MAIKKTVETIEIRPVEIETVGVRIVGDTPLIMHRWSEKAKREILDKEMGKAKGIVMDGRDIGTVVFPDAELKIFVTASAEIRAQRRYDELKAKGQEASFEEILKNVKERDYIDQNRAVRPLRQAEDAILLDNSHLTIEEQKQWLAEQFQRIIHG